MDVAYKIPKSILNYILTNPSTPSNFFLVFTFLQEKRESKCHVWKESFPVICQYYQAQVKQSGTALQQSNTLT